MGFFLSREVCVRAWLCSFFFPPVLCAVCCRCPSSAFVCSQNACVCPVYAHGGTTCFEVSLQPYSARRIFHRVWFGLFLHRNSASFSRPSFSRSSVRQGVSMLADEIIDYWEAHGPAGKVEHGTVGLTDPLTRAGRGPGR